MFKHQKKKSAWLYTPSPVAKAPDGTGDKVRCLKCQKMFESVDRRTNRICHKCNLLNGKAHGLRTLTTGRLDGRSRIPTDLD
jgi:hypothetical protein